MAIKKKLLIQLPYKKYTNYLPFLTNLKVLNFVRNDLGTDIIQYHKKLNKQGHMTIGKSLFPTKHTDLTGTYGCRKNNVNNILVKYIDGIQVGNMFWVFNAVIGKHVLCTVVCKIVHKFSFLVHEWQFPVIISLLASKCQDFKHRGL